MHTDQQNCGTGKGECSYTRSKSSCLSTNFTVLTHEPAQLEHLHSSAHVMKSNLRFSTWLKHSKPMGRLDT